MYTGILHTHNLLAWLVLAVGLAVVALALTQKAAFAKHAGKVRLFTILAHLQLLAGLTLWFISPTVADARAAMGATMKDPALRRLVVEHPTLMIAAVIVATITSVRVRKAASSEQAASRALVGTAVALVLAAAVIPWDRLFKFL